MEHTTRRRQTVTQLDRLECDRCHRAFEAAADVFEVQEFLRVNTRGGFGAKLGDGVRVQIDLCQHCWGEVLGPWLRLDGQPVSDRAEVAGHKDLNPGTPS